MVQLSFLKTSKTSSKTHKMCKRGSSVPAINQVPNNDRHSCCKNLVYRGEFQGLTDTHECTFKLQQKKDRDFCNKMLRKFERCD